MTALELCLYIQEAQVVVAQNEKQEIYRMTVAIASLFKEGLFEEYVGALDAVITGKDVEPPKVEKSLKELNKLNSLFGGK